MKPSINISGHAYVTTCIFLAWSLTYEPFSVTWIGRVQYKQYNAWQGYKLNAFSYQIQRIYTGGTYMLERDVKNKQTKRPKQNQQNKKNQHKFHFENFLDPCLQAWSVVEDLWQNIYSFYHFSKLELCLIYTTKGLSRNSSETIQSRKYLLYDV